MWKLKSYLRPYWKATVLAPLFMIIEVAMDILQPTLMASMINNGVMNGDSQHILHMGLLMLLVALIGLFGGIGCTVFSSTASLNFATDVRKDLFQTVQSLSFRQLDAQKEGSLITRLTNDVTQVQNLVQIYLRSLVRAPLLAIGSMAMAMAINLQLTFILIGMVPLIVGVIILLMRITAPLFSTVQTKLDRVNGVLQENLKGIRVVKAFDRSDFERARMEQANREYTAVAVKATRVMSLNMPIIMLILNGSIVAILWFGAKQIWSGLMELGDLVALIQYVIQLLFAILMVSRVMMNVSKARVSAGRINDLISQEAELQDAKDAVTDVITSGQVVFEKVSFSYDGQQENILNRIDLVAQPGKTIAILGATGSGKSTLVSLIPRMYEVTSGRILIDGVDIRNISLEHLRSKIGIVQQQTLLFSGTIRDNICFGKPMATQEEIEAAAIAAQAHDFILNLPEGYDTMIGQRGVKLSGGQKQRISIARALLIKPAILILDDSTSAVDTATETRLQAALKDVMEKCTTFHIAQRISSVIDADLIIVLEAGEIIASGTHEELLENSPIYQEICFSQHQKGEQIDD